MKLLCYECGMTWKGNYLQECPICHSEKDVVVKEYDKGGKMGKISNNEWEKCGRTKTTLLWNDKYKCYEGGKIYDESTGKAYLLNVREPYSISGSSKGNNGKKAITVFCTCVRKR